jgi:hypothetical protein
VVVVGGRRGEELVGGGSDRRSRGRMKTRSFFAAFFNKQHIYIGIY